MYELISQNIGRLFSEESKDSQDKEEEIPINIECDELLLILGPSLKYMTNHENTTEDSEVDDDETKVSVDMNSYDALHYLKVVEARLKHRLQTHKKQEEATKKQKIKEDIEERKNRVKNGDTDPDSLVKAFTMLLKLLNVKVKKVHIRYEEDYFVTNEPYSFGLVVDSMEFRSYDRDIRFKSPIDVTYQEFNPKDTNRVYLK